MSTASDRPGGGTAASVSTHVLDTGAGHPAAGITVMLAARAGRAAAWADLGAARTAGNGRCQDLPALPEGTTHARLTFDTGAHHASGAGQEGGAAFFPEVAVTFAVSPGEHYHVPLLLSPYGYSVYRGS